MRNIPALSSSLYVDDSITVTQSNYYYYAALCCVKAFKRTANTLQRWWKVKKNDRKKIDRYKFPGKSRLQECLSKYFRFPVIPWYMHQYTTQPYIITWRTSTKGTRNCIPTNLRCIFILQNKIDDFILQEFPGMHQLRQREWERSRTGKEEEMHKIALLLILWHQQKDSLFFLFLQCTLLVKFVHHSSSLVIQFPIYMNHSRKRP